jgi:proteic killer suppression protein
MIKSFKHKGLAVFFYDGNRKVIKPDHADKIARILDRLDASVSVQDMNLPGFRLYPLTGDRQDSWAVSVNANWRITFFFQNGDAYVVNYEDYH